MFVFTDTGEGVVVGVVDDGSVLEVFTVEFDEVEMFAPVWEFAVFIPVVFVYRTAVQDEVGLYCCQTFVSAFCCVPVDQMLDVLKSGVEPDADVGVVKHSLEDGAVATQRDALVTVLEVTVVPADVYRYTPCDGGVEVFRVQVPLFLGVEAEDVLIDVVRKEPQVFIVCLTQLEDGYLDVVAEGLEEFPFQPDSNTFREDLVD